MQGNGCGEDGGWDGGDGCSLAVKGCRGGDGGGGGGGGGNGGNGGDGGDGGGRGEGGDDGGTHPGASTPCALHASGHIAANGSVKDRPAGGTNVVPPKSCKKSLKRNLQALAAASSPFGLNSRLRSAAP